MEFRYIIFRKTELEQNGKYVPGVARLLHQLKKSKIAVCIIAGETAEQVQVMMKNQGLSAMDGLMIASTDATIQLANELQLAVIAYANPDFGGEECFGAPMLVQRFGDVDVSLLERQWQRKHGLPWRILETKRCYLRELALFDMDALFALYEPAGMTDYIEPLYERMEEEKYQRAYIKNMYGFYGYGMWLVCERETDKVIGRAGLEHRQIGGEMELEMGYAIAVEYQNKGYATEICQAIIRYAADNLAYERINCLIEKENQISLALVAKLGFHWLESIVEHGKKYEHYVLLL